VTGTVATVCDLCAADRVTEWFYEDDVCWVAECEQCAVPMVVWRVHHPDPPSPLRAAMEARLVAVVTEHYDFEHWIDDTMRSIPDHFHAHARPRVGFTGYGRRRRV
jgi:hypothetical protein